MKFSVLQQDILPPLQAVSRSVGVRTSLPVLENILLQTEEGKLKLAATNLEIGIIKYLPINIIEDGQITVPAKTLVEIISGLSPATLEIESKAEILSIKSVNFTASINGISSTEFPAIPRGEGKGVIFKSQDLITCSQIFFAAAIDEGRPQLSGILTHATGGKLDFVATDGFRLAHRLVHLTDPEIDFKRLIPRKTFEEVIRVITEEGCDEIKISTTEDQNQIVFNFGQSIISSRLIEGQFPNWEKIIPSTTVSRVVLEKDLFLKAIKLAAIFAKNEANIIIIKISKEGLKLESSAKELGSQQNQLEANIEGEDLEIAFNARFLIDAVSANPTNQLMIEFSGTLSAALIKPTGLEGLEFIIMPVRLS